MAATRTLAQLRTSVQQRGAYENSVDITSTILDEFINEAIAETYDVIVAKWEDYYTVRGDPFSTVSGTESYALPDDFYKLRKVEIQMDSLRWRRLYPHAIEAAHLYTTWGLLAKSYRYRLQAGDLVLVPTPQTVESVRLYYIPIAGRLVDDSDTFDGINGYEELVIQLALMRCKSREELPVDDIEREVARLLARVRTAADGRDAGEPFYLDPQGPYGGVADDEGWWP